MTPAWQATDDELLVGIEAAQGEINETFAQLVELIGEARSRGLAEAKGYRDLPDLVRSVQNVSRSTARSRVKAAEQLAPRRQVSGEALEPDLPVLAAAVAEGALTPEHVREIQAVLAALPPHLDERRAPLEADLTGHARCLDPDAVRRLGRHALALLDPDGARPREPKPTRNKLTLRSLGEGFEARGFFDRESAAIIRSALSPLTAPCPTVPVQDDCCADGEHAGHEPGERDPRSAAERTADGLVELARRMLATGALGVEAGQAVQVTVTVPLETLVTREGGALIGFGDGTLRAAIDAEAALRLACDARMVPIVLASTGEPLFVGREKRCANRAQRRALAQRDGGCAFPGCDAPPQWCVAHHVRHWAHGGCTDLDNLVLLCSQHHTLIHKGDWVITMEGGFPLFHPPPWVPGGPRRNMLQRPDLVGRIPAQRPPPRVATQLVG
ncbi:DUF222 domain-containing protein [Pseudonocardia nematodicida]|uniref:DUF222 domain-containing protein n=1 Tax=Pseudonocardia nematodicida TaxID=1206997 RepID=A0ABV1K3P7_9PSEU